MIFLRIGIPTHLITHLIPDRSNAEGKIEWSRQRFVVEETMYFSPNSLAYLTGLVYT